MILNSVKRIQGQHNIIRLSITFPILNQICQQLQKGIYNLYINCLIETVCIVAFFFAFLRCGEFSVVYSYKFDPAVNHCVGDIPVFTNYVILRLKESKIDPFRKGIDINVSKWIGLYVLFSALRKYLLVRQTKFVKMSPMDPLFVTDSYEALSRQYFLDKLKFILQLCGYDPTLYNGHSFR